MKEALYDWGGLNAWLFTLINGLSGAPGYNRLMVLLSELGEYPNFKYYFILLLLLWLGQMGVQKFYRKRPVERAQVHEIMALLITLMMGYLFLGLLVGATKLMIPLPRPFMYPEIRASMHFAGPYPDPADYSASFPSPHAATMVFVVAALWHTFPSKPMHVLGIALVALVCWSRIAVGMQFPADVLAGVLLGLIPARYVRRYVYRMMRLPLPAPPPAPFRKSA